MKRVGRLRRYELHIADKRSGTFWESFEQLHVHRVTQVSLKDDATVKFSFVLRVYSQGHLAYFGGL